MRQREEALKQREETFRQTLNEELEAQVRLARREIDDVIAGAEGEDRSHRARSRRHDGLDRRHGRARGAMRAPPSMRSRSAFSSQSGGQPERERRDRSPRPASATASSWQDSGSQAVVTAIHDGSADLDVRGKRMRASVRDLEWSAPLRAVAPAAPRVNVHVELQPATTRRQT